jgi:hypothetical protein
LRGLKFFKKIEKIFEKIFVFIKPNGSENPLIRQSGKKRPVKKEK